MAVTLPTIRLPQHWPNSVKSALVCAVAFAQAAIVETRSWCADSPVERVRLSADNERLKAEIALLREELRIKDARLARIHAAKRPHYPPTERLAILALKAARNWSNAQTARAFLLTDATIANWLHRVDEQGEGRNAGPSASGWPWSSTITRAKPWCTVFTESNPPHEM
jgi:predicted RNA polymerase sigma factor